MFENLFQSRHKRARTSSSNAPVPPRPRNDRPFSADALRQSTIEALYDEGASELRFSVARMFALFDDDIENAYAKISKRLSKAAKAGKPAVSLRFNAYADDELDSGIDVEKLSGDKDTFDVTIWNFREPKWDRRRKDGLAFSNDDEAEKFESALIDEYSNRLRNAGFTVSEEDSHCTTRIVKVSWMEPAEYRDAKQAMGMPGGYGAYKNGVSLEDIVA